MQFSPDRKRRSDKQNQCSASDSVGLIFTRSYRFTLLITTPTTSPSLVKTSLKNLNSTKCSWIIACMTGVRREGKGERQDEPVNCEKIGRGRIAVGDLLPPALILTFFPPFLRPATQASWIISNGNRAEWSPIRSVIIRVITKSDDRAAGVRFVYHEYDYRLNWTTRSPIIN